MKSFETVKILKPIIRPTDSKDYPFLRLMFCEAKPPFSILELSVEEDS